MFNLFVSTYQAWREPRRPVELPRLTEAQLHDLGLARNEAASERKPAATR